ncbi:MAG: hypothetical protein H0V49_05625 [Nocardioidaceae bacterium]|nr:hypothetical protein [Nocardioidaceae bacterium]
MVDETRVLRLLRAVTDALAPLDLEASASDDRRADAMWLPGVKYTFIAAIEACVDIAQHVCSAEGGGRRPITKLFCASDHGVPDSARMTEWRAT